MNRIRELLMGTWKAITVAPKLVPLAEVHPAHWEDPYNCPECGED